MPRQPKLLDMFCKEGGASAGYVDAGFDVVGIDKMPQPRYPYTFIQADALDVLADQAYLRSFDVLAGSPPCQAHSALGRSNPAHRYADFIPQTRAAFQATGRPYVIENVVGAPLHNPILLCGSMFGLGAGGYQLLRHRLFEISAAIAAPACGHDDRPVIGVYGGKARCRRRGNGVPSMGTNLPKLLGEQAMGIGWMTIYGLSEAIPPAYTLHVGRQLMTSILESPTRPTLAR